MSKRLTWEQVDEIRSLYASKQISQRELGKMYGVSQTSIRYIVHYMNWKPENDPRSKAKEREYE